MPNKVTRVLTQQALARQFRYLLLEQRMQIDEWQQALDVYLLDVPKEDREDARWEIQQVFGGHFLTWAQFRMGLVILGLKTDLSEEEVTMFRVVVHNNRLVRL